MDAATPPRKGRDADRSRESILNAAEQIFAEVGYDAASLQAIGARAGVSRGTPGYFFGSKEMLYDAVLDRLLAAELAFVGAALGATSQPGSTAAIAASLETTIDAFLEFLAARPSFTRLLDREALAGGALLRSTSAHAQSLEAARSIATSLLEPNRTRPLDPAAFILAVVAMCWFPFTHAETFAGPLGIDVATPDGRARWRRHLVALVVTGIRTSERPDPDVETRRTAGG